MNYLTRSTPAASLAVFRIAFGLLILVGIVRFWLKGWISELYIEPRLYFPFYGLEFVKPLGDYTYGLFFLCGLSALLVALGLFYRVASVLLFLSFTYIELIDKSTYLNHYYFISMISLLMIVIPAHACFSLDARRVSGLHSDRVPAWSRDVLVIFICLVYFYAGLAKINSDWLLKALPLRIWLPAKNDLPILGPLLEYPWVAYAFSWIGCLYDLSIPFLLLNRITRPVAFCLVVTFHVLTAMLFPIGMFPYIMIASALIFFSPQFHAHVLARLGSWLKVSKNYLAPTNTYTPGNLARRLIPAMLAVFLVVQAVLPFRYLLYPGELFWTEEGYRFSWRVMLMEKAGHAQFIVKDKSGTVTMVDNKEFLTPLQEKMVATQPDMILQYAHALTDHYAREGHVGVEVYADTYVTLNGRLGKPLIDPTVDLATQEESFAHKDWILEMNDEINGF